MPPAKQRDMTNDMPFKRPAQREEQPDPTSIPAGGESVYGSPSITPKTPIPGNTLDPLGGAQKPYRFVGG